MRFQVIFVLALVVILALAFQNVNGEEQNLEIRHRRDGPKHHPDIGRNRGRDSSPGRKGHGHLPGGKKSKSPHHPSKHGGKGKHGGSKHGKKHDKKPGHGRRNGGGHH